MERALRPCKARGCNNLTRDEYGYCKDHIQGYLDKLEEQKKARMKRYDENRKDSPYRNFYTNKRWKYIRNYALARDNYLCQDCCKDNKITMAEHVHHVVEIKDDWDRRYDVDNLISLCYKCHNKRHKRF